MFFGVFQESRGKMPEVSKNAFHAFLKYLYADLVIDVNLYAFEISKLAHYYEVTELKNICEAQLLKELNYENALEMFHHAHRFRFEVQLKKRSFDLIQELHFIYLLVMI